MLSSITWSITAMTDDKIRENRLRRVAERQGLRIIKSRRRDPRALDYGGYMLSDESNNSVMGRYWRTLDEIETYLLGDKKGPKTFRGRKSTERKNASSS